ncbi:DUF3365 domain-containing protein [Candidatus Riflebacteria bacterium]
MIKEPVLSAEHIPAPGYVDLKKQTLFLCLMWSIFVLFIALLHYYQAGVTTNIIARNHARVFLKKDLVYRRWNTNHGGVYVPVQGHTQPNPYLTDIKEREIKTPSGKLLTLMNPAYMTRQVHELAAESKIYGHITSLNPIRPQNAPDPWEKIALQSFENGNEEYYAVAKIADRPFFRLMQPLITKKRCLKCHEKQGYKENDIRGGLSVSIPMQPLWHIEKRDLIFVNSGLLFLWIMGLFGIGLAMRQIRKQIELLVEYERNLRIAKENAEKATKLKDKFVSLVAHDLKGPITVLIGFIDLFTLGPDSSRLKEKQKSFLTKMMDNCIHMTNMINEVLNLSRLQTGNLKVEPVELQLFEEVDIAVENLLFLASQKEILLKNEIPEGTRFFADPGLFSEVIKNLISNAIKFCKDGDEIKIFLQNEEPLILCIQDTGSGIEAEMLPKLFLHEVKTSTSGTAGEMGTGLGLPFSMEIMKAHSGNLRVESKIGHGTTFFIEFSEKKELPENQ